MPAQPVILITGASSGIGAATARLCGRKGFRLVLAARRGDRLRSLAEEIRGQGGEVISVPTDVSKGGQIANLVQTALDSCGRIDVLFNNAGVGRMNWLEALDPLTDIDFQVQVNLLGVIQTTRLVLPHMLQQGHGHIINMASIAGLIGTPQYSIYAATKFGVRGFTEGLRREVNLLGIRVTGIYPGGVETEFAQYAGLKPGRRFTTPHFLRLTAEDVARAVLDVVHKPRPTVVIPRLMWGVVWLNRFAPRVVDWIINRSYTRGERGVG